MTKQDRLIYDLFNVVQELLTELGELGVKRAPKFRSLVKRAETYIDLEMKDDE